MKDTSFPKLNSSSWREAYEANNLIRYEAPNKEAVSFIYDNIIVAGGHHGYNVEYTSYGGWSNYSITETSNKITVSGFLRGDEYLSSRATLVEAFKIKTDDENPAFIFIPLWGRLRAVLIDWNIEENAGENGQCKINLNFNLALKHDASEVSLLSLEKASDNLNSLAVSQLEKDLSKENMSFTSFISSVNEYASEMSKMIGKIQGKAEYINKSAIALNTLTNTISSQVKTVSVYASALINVYSQIANTLIEIKQQASIQNTDDIESLVRNLSPIELAERNIKKTIILFSSLADMDTSKEHTKSEEIDTAKVSDNFIKIAAINSLAILITQTEEAKSKMKNYIALFDKLFDSIDKNGENINLALIDLRVAMIEEIKEKIINKGFGEERKIKFNKNNNLLNVEHYLKCYKLRELNFIEDSLNLDKEIIYI